MLRGRLLLGLTLSALLAACAQGQTDAAPDAEPPKGDDPIDVAEDKGDDATADDAPDAQAQPDAETPDVATPDVPAPPDASVPEVSPPDAAPDRPSLPDVAVMDAAPDVPAPPPDRTPPPPDVAPPPPDVAPPPPDVAPPPPDAALVCRYGLTSATCRARENCCTTLGVAPLLVAVCGCTVPILGCVARGLPGCT